MPMLKDYPMITTLPATNIERAKKFYGEVLGLKPVETEMPEDAVMFEAGSGTKVYLYKRGASRADHTALEFHVTNLEKEMEDLKAKGVVFEEYDMPGLKTENSIAKMGNYKSAWFKDTEGNILALGEEIK